jgi:hypothetical protein
MLHTAVVKVSGDLTSQDLVDASRNAPDLPENIEFTPIDSKTLQITLEKQVPESTIEKLLGQLITLATPNDRWYTSKIDEIRIEPAELIGISYFSVHQAYAN